MGGRGITLVVAVFVGYCIVAPAVSQQLSPEDLPSLENVTLIANWEERCRNSAGDAAWEDIKSSTNELWLCVQKHIKFGKLQREVNISIERGELDLLFKKYCKKRDKLMGCAEEMFSKLERCTTPQENKDLDITRDIIDAGIDFACDKDGDKIALFMAEKGEECLKNHSKNIEKCMEDKIPGFKDLKDDPESMNIAKFTFNEENCKKLVVMKECVEEHTSKCDDETPANILGSMITQMLKKTPCSQASGASALLSHTQYLLPHLLTLVAAALTAANILL